ncbi:MAG: hypothetical protein U0359_31810 [Byssovorax sp.]
MNHRSILLAGSLLPIFALACGSVSVAPSGGTGGSTATSTSTTGGSTVTTTGTGMSTGGSGGGGGSGGAPMCGETQDKLDFVLSTWDGKTVGCQSWDDDLVELNATVADAGPDFLTLDSCAPNADCLPELSKLTVKAKDLTLTHIPMGAFVRVEAQGFHFQGGCGHKILITNLPVWGGLPNPQVPLERLWLLAADGNLGYFEDAPLMVDTVPLGCYPNDPPGCGEHDDDLLRFRTTSKPDDPGTTVAMGQSKIWSMISGQISHPVLGRNLRSFTSGICDGPVELAFWVRFIETPD